MMHGKAQKKKKPKYFPRFGSKNVSQDLFSIFLSHASFQANTNGQFAFILAIKESEWKITVDAVRKSIHSNLVYEFAYIF